MQNSEENVFHVCLELSKQLSHIFDTLHQNHYNNPVSKQPPPRNRHPPLRHHYRGDIDVAYAPPNVTIFPEILRDATNGTMESNLSLKELRLPIDTKEQAASKNLVSCKPIKTDEDECKDKGVNRLKEPILYRDQLRDRIQMCREEFILMESQSALAKQPAANLNESPKKSKNQNVLSKQKKENPNGVRDLRLPKIKKYPDAAAQMFATAGSVKNIVLLSISQSNKVQLKRHKVDMCMRDLENLGKHFRAYPIGSRVIGTANLASDLDVFLDMGGMYFGIDYQDAHSQSDFVYILENMLSRNPAIWKRIFTIPSARTPIVKVIHIPSQLSCDISLRHGLGYENTQFIKYMMRIRPMMAPLILLLKKWIINANLTSHMRNFALSIMILFYMQVKKYLPPLYKLREYCKTPPKIIAGWECHYSQDPAALAGLQTPENFFVLLHGFFLYYGHTFNYETEVVCPLMGDVVQKVQFDNNGAKLPVEMRRYCQMVNRVTDRERSFSHVSAHVMDHPSKEVFRKDAALCIQDPFDLSHNLAKATPKTFLDKFVHYCTIETKKCASLKDNVDWTNFKEPFWK